MSMRNIKSATNQGRPCLSLALRYLIILISFMPASLSAQAWKAGRSSLMKNDFKTAQTQLTLALKSAKSKTELADTYKYLGVSQFMLGNKQAATASFQRAKTYNPSVNLTASEVVDESVIPLFRAAKTSKSTAVAPPQNKKGKPVASAPPGVSKQ